MTDVPRNQHLTRQEREWCRRRREILEAATRLLLERGPNGTTMQMIAEAAEFSVGYLYKHFPGKRELLTEIIETRLEAHAETRRQVRAEFQGRPLAGLRQEIRQVSRQLVGQAHLVQLILGSGAIDSEQIKRRLLSYRQQDADLLAQAMARGELRRTDPRLLAATLDGVIWGLIGLMYETGRLDQATLIPDIVDDLVLKPLGTDGRTNARKERST